MKKIEKTVKIPCEDCITLGICISYVVGGPPFYSGINSIIQKCQLFNKYMIYLINKNASFNKSYAEAYKFFKEKNRNENSM